MLKSCLGRLSRYRLRAHLFNQPSPKAQADGSSIEEERAHELVASVLRD
jgi:hypothetical protein